MNLTSKKEVVEKLHSTLAESQIALLVANNGLDVESMTQLRNDLRKEHSEIKIAKNTLLSMASEGTYVSVIKEFLNGPNAIVTSKVDPVAPAKVITKFADTNQKLEIKVAALNGKLLNVDDIKMLAKMPPKEIMLAQVLSAMNAVPTAMVRVLGEVPRSFLYLLNSIGELKKAA